MKHVRYALLLTIWALTGLTKIAGMLVLIYLMGVLAVAVLASS